VVSEISDAYLELIEEVVSNRWPKVSLPIPSIAGRCHLEKALDPRVSTLVGARDEYKTKNP
jgi:hypothetical protein